MEGLEWSECNESLDDILKNPRVQLPQLIKLSCQLSDIDSKDCLEKEQIIVIHSKETINTVQGADSTGKTINIPVGCPHKIRRKVAPGKEKVFESIADLAKSEPLPRFVEVKESQGIENISGGDRLKVVIVEKTGGVPSFIHFRSSSGKHVKLSVDEKVSFQLSVSDGSDQYISKLKEKSREFPINAEFQKSKETPKTHTDLGVFTISKCSSYEIVIASAKKGDIEYAVTFPLDFDFKFQINSKLKMAKNEEYRQLCSTASTLESSEIAEFLNNASPTDPQMRYVIKYKKLQKILKFDYSSEEEKSDSSPQNIFKFKRKDIVVKKEKKETVKKEKKNTMKKESPKAEKKESSKNEDVHAETSEKIEDEEEALPPNTLVMDAEQKELLRKEIKEKEKQAKLEKEQLKADKKKEKKMKKEKEKEEKKKKKLSTSSISSSNPGSPVEIQSEDLYMCPQDELDVSKGGESPEPLDEQQSQLALYLMSKVKKVRDRTTSIGRPKNKKRGKLRKEDIEYVSSDHIGTTILPGQEESYYTGLGGDDTFSESLYEALPGDMAYESLDLIAQAQRTLAPPIPTENSGDSGFDEIDQARIKAWRDAMAPPPLPGNHPLQDQQQSHYEEENLYETAVDCKTGGQKAAWQNFHDSVQQSTSEISSWDMEDVASCLTDILLEKHVEIFSDSQVDGHLLLDLDESVLKDLSLSAFESRKLRKFVFGWRPDIIRPPTYAKRGGFDSKDPTQWSQDDVVAHLKVIEINDFADFCQKNQVNGELLKDICVDEAIMNSIITTRDKKLKSVKIRNYVIDQWRPKKKGEGNYVSSNSILPPEKRSYSTPNVNKIGNNSPKEPYTTQKTSQNSPKEPYTDRKTSQNSPKNKKVSDSGELSLIDKMKLQLEENKNSWEKKK